MIDFSALNCEPGAHTGHATVFRWASEKGVKCIAVVNKSLKVTI